MVEIFLVVNRIPMLCSETILLSHTKLHSLDSEGLIGVFQKPGMKYSCVRILVGVLGG